MDRTRPQTKWAQRLIDAKERRKWPRKMNDAWVEVVLDARWMVAYRIFPGPVVGEVRVYPNEQTAERPAGMWSAEVLGGAAPVPAGGLTAGVMRQVAIREHWQFGPRFTAWLNSDLPKTVSKALLLQSPAFKAMKAGKAGSFGASILVARPARGRRPQRSNEFYAKLARDYVDRLTQGSPRPTADIARSRRLPQSKVRDLLHVARKRGFLSETTRGRSGGTLMPKAHVLLTQAARR